MTEFYPEPTSKAIGSFESDQRPVVAVSKAIGSFEDLHVQRRRDANNGSVRANPLLVTL